MKKQVLFLVGLLFASYTYGTIVDIKTIDKIIDVLSVLEADADSFNQTLFFSDIDEVLITVKKNQETGVEQYPPVEGVATKGFFDLIKSRAIGLTARPLDQRWSPLTYKTLEDQGFRFEASDLQIPLLSDQIISLCAGINQQGQQLIAGWYKGILYATYTPKKMVLSHFLNTLVTDNINLSENIFFIDDQITNIDDVASLFSDQVAAGVIAQAVGLSEQFILFLREKIKKITLVHYRYSFLEAKKNAEEKFVSALQEKIDSAGVTSWGQEIAEMQQKPLSEYSFEQKKTMYGKCCFWYDTGINLLHSINTFYRLYNERAFPLYGPLVTDQSIQDQKSFLESNLLPYMYSFIESLRESLYQGQDDVPSGLALDSQVHCDFEYTLDSDSSDNQQAHVSLEALKTALELYRVHLLLYKPPVYQSNDSTEIFKKKCFDSVTQALYKLHEALEKVKDGKFFYRSVLRKIKVYCPDFTPPVLLEQKTTIQDFSIDSINLKEMITQYSKNPHTWVLLDIDFFQEVQDQPTGYMLQDLFSSLGQNIPTFIGITDTTFGEKKYNNVAFDFHMHGAVSDLESFGFNAETGQEAMLNNSVIYSAGMPYASIIYNILKQVAFKDVGLLPATVIVIGKQKSSVDIRRLFSDLQFDSDRSPATLQLIRDKVKDLICISYRQPQ